MKKMKRLATIFLVMALIWSSLPVMTVSAAGNDLSAYVTITDFKIYYADGTEVDSTISQEALTSYSNGFDQYVVKNVKIYWELNLPSGMTVTEDDYFTIQLFSEGYWAVGNTASTDFTVNELGGSIPAGTWSITSRVAKVILGSATNNKSGLSGTLTTGNICYPNLLTVADVVKPVTMGDCTYYYKYKQVANNNYNTTGKFGKYMSSSTNNSISWFYLMGHNYLSSKANVPAGTGSWPGSIDSTEVMEDLFVVDMIEEASSISNISLNISTRIYAKGPSSTSYEDYSLGSLFLANIAISSNFINVGTFDNTSFADLDAFKTYVKSQSNGVGSYGIYEDKTADKYYAVSYYDAIPSTNLTYGDILGTTTMGDYLQSTLGSDVIPDADKSWYDTVYGANDPIYLFRLGVELTYNDTVLTGSKDLENGGDFYYYMDSIYTEESLTSKAAGSMYPVDGYAALPWDSAAIIKYESDGVTGLGGVTFKLQYWDSTSNTWVDYTVNGNLYTGTTSDNGQLIVKDLPEGKYRFVETNPATGYDINSAKYYSDIADMQAAVNDITDPNEHFTVQYGVDGSYIYATNEKEEYSITYEANAPSGTSATGTTVDNNTYHYGDLASIAANNFDVTDYVFIGWNTQADGNGTYYAENGNLTITENTTLYAQWHKNNPYMVIYNANNGIGSYVDDNSGSGYAQGTTYTVLDSAATGISYPGHTFVGWNTQPDGSGQSYLGTSNITDFVMPAGNMTLYAQWEDTLYKVTYDPNGGTGGIEVNNLSYQSIHTVLGNAATGVNRTGFDFDGWNTKADGSGTDYRMSDLITITEDVILYAKWKQRAQDTYYTVTYDGNGGLGALIDPYSPYLANEDAVVLENNDAFTRNGYTFTGWNTASDGTGDDYNGTETITMTENITFYAQWRANNHTVTYNANGGSGSYTDNVKYDDTYIVKSDSATSISNTGYTFDGWNTEADGSGNPYAAGETINITGDVTLYAKWKAIEYSVTYDANGGSGSYIDSSLHYGDSYIIKNDSATSISNTGFTFDGWNTLADGTGTPYAAGETISITADVTLYARWKAIDYSVNYDANGGSGSYTDSSLHYGDSYIIKSDSAAGISRTGYSFDGWNTAADGTGTPYTAGETISITNDVTLYARWRAVEYSVTYDANGGTGSHTDALLYYGDTYTIKTDSAVNISNAGYTFIGWNTEPGGNGTSYDANSSLTITDNVTLYAQWIIVEPGNWYVVYNANGGIGSKTVAESVLNNHTVQSAADAGISRTGYEFVEWTTDIEGNNLADLSIAAQAEGTLVTLYAQWKALEFSVSYDANGGTGSHTDSPVYYNDSYTVKSDIDTSISYAGYSFVCWNSQPDGTGTSYDANAVLTIMENVILYAQWTENINTYSVIYDANGGTGSHSDFPLYYGDSYTVKSENDTSISLDGYTFIDWNTESDGTGTSYDANDNFTITENVTLYAHWMINSYTVTYNANGGVGSHTDSPLYYGDSYIVKSEGDTSISNDGYSFVGWNTAEDGTGTSYPANAAVTIVGDITLYAQWETDPTNPSPKPDDESESESTTESESDETTTAASDTTASTTTSDSNAGSPKTGDQTNAMTLLILLVGCIGGAGIILSVKRRRR